MLARLSRRTLGMCSLILYGLNLLDYILTIRLVYFLGFGAEAEANWLISAGFRSFPLGVMLYKLLFVGLLVLFLYYKSETGPIARVGIIGLLAVYSALLVYHAFIIVLTLGFIV